MSFKSSTSATECRYYWKIERRMANWIPKMNRIPREKPPKEKTARQTLRSKLMDSKSQQHWKKFHNYLVPKPLISFKAQTLENFGFA